VNGSVLACRTRANSEFMAGTSGAADAG